MGAGNWSSRNPDYVGHPRDEARVAQWSQARAALAKSADIELPAVASSNCRDTARE
jgi:hypothetical protein